jgi:hypothetical protein
VIFFPRDGRAGAAISSRRIKSPRICRKDARHGDIGALWYRTAPNAKTPANRLKMAFTGKQAKRGQNDRAKEKPAG